MTYTHCTHNKIYKLDLVTLWYGIAKVGGIAHGYYTTCLLLFPHIFKNQAHNDTNRYL